MRKLLLLAPLLLIAGCSASYRSCVVEMDTRDKYDGESVQLRVDTKPDPPIKGYGSIKSPRIGERFVYLPYLVNWTPGKPVAQFDEGGQTLYLKCES